MLGNSVQQAIAGELKDLVGEPSPRTTSTMDSLPVNTAARSVFTAFASHFRINATVTENSRAIAPRAPRSDPQDLSTVGDSSTEAGWAMACGGAST
ncbi:hypothetical protein MHAE_03750 [Mycobacterium haemophilum DSM 44634]|nr:hypothetical protein B586_20020 [Mycobacterium haemophilum DSM 44634]